MYRDIEQILSAWFYEEDRLPLVLRGARQVGKTYIVEKFAKSYFQNYVNINFEYEPVYSRCFESLNPTEILKAISSIHPQDIILGKTLLFLDEIQICPRAITALRYFKEKLPELHVIAAGSLLEFTLKSEDLAIPVGRIQYLYLKPLSFREFLIALNYQKLLDQLEAATVEMPIADIVHEKLLKLVREYFIIGGMPASVSAYIKTHQHLKSQRIQLAIASTFRNDFGKYAKLTQHALLQKVFEKTPILLGQQLKYNQIDSEIRSREIKLAINYLCLAGVIHYVYATHGSGLPLHAMINEKKFKLLFLDIGLVNRLTHTSLIDLLNSDITLINNGALAEQFVGQELLAYQDYYEEPLIHFWERDALNAQAEIDYMVSFDNKIIPIEVKAGTTGRLKSLQIVMKEKNLPLGLRISETPLSRNQQILSVPFYMLYELPRLLEMYL